MASVPGRLAVRDEDVQLGAVAPGPMQIAAAMFTPVLLMAAATSAGASGGVSGGVLGIRPELHLGSKHHSHG